MVRGRRLVCGWGPHSPTTSSWPVTPSNGWWWILDDQHCLLGAIRRCCCFPDFGWLAGASWGQADWHGFKLVMAYFHLERKGLTPIGASLGGDGFTV